MKEKIQVHIADDHKILIEGIVAVINTEDDIEIEGYSLNGKEVIDWAEDHSADVLILDINMPIYDGIEVLKFFKIKKINQKVIILSSYEDVKLVQEMINLGANGFLSKDSAGQHIVEAIRTVHEGEQYFSDTIKNNLLKLYTGKNVRPGQRPQSTIANSLTDRETEVLKLISQEYSSP
jgi:DNA-binding NarL/FixJ family response regulator